jgi:hypothetical protein
MKRKSQQREYYCLGVRRNYETIWRMVSKHDSREEAEAELAKRRAFTGVFNYDNADLRVMSRAEAKQIFGQDWEYAPIGSPKSK